MFSKLRSHLAHNVVGYLALFVALGGTAYAVDTIRSEDIVDGEVKTPDLGQAAVTREKIANAAVIQDKINNDAVDGTKVSNGSLTGEDVQGGSLVGDDVRNESLTGADVFGDSLKGADIDEASLASVPSARLGGIGRWSLNGNKNSCDPESEAVVTCAKTIAINLPVRTRVLVNAQATAVVESGANSAQGRCFIGTSATGALPASETAFTVFRDGEGSTEKGALVAVTPLVGPGPVSFGVDCNQDQSFGAIRYFNVGLTAVALSPH